MPRATGFKSARRLATGSIAATVVAASLVFIAPTAAHARWTVQQGPFSTQTACNQAAMLDTAYYASVGPCFTYFTDPNKWYYKRTDF